MEDPYVSLRDRLKTNIIGKKIIYYPKLSSTMDTAAREAGRGAPEGTTIIAGEQTRARGRLQRQWITTRGNIAFSIILRPGISILSYLMMTASLAVTRGIEMVTGLKPQIKWPNDVLIRGRKVCGILIENRLSGDGVDFSVTGIGINVSSMPASASTPATSLYEETGVEIPLVDIVASILEEFERLYLTLPDGEPVFTAWRDRLITIGKRVGVRSGGETLEGTAESVDREGGLLLRHADGSTTRIIAGDVTLVSG